MQIDPKTQAILDLLYPDFKVRVIRILGDMYRQTGLMMKATEGMRSFETQAKYYAQGRTTPGPIKTNAKPGLSTHHYGIAIDLCFSGADPYLEKSKDGKKMWAEYAKFATAHGLVNGSTFKGLADWPHSELRYGGLTVHQMLELHNHGGLKAVWAKFDQIRNVPIGSEWGTLKLL